MEICQPGIGDMSPKEDVSRGLEICLDVVRGAHVTALSTAAEASASSSGGSSGGFSGGGKGGGNMGFSHA